jgi:nucleotide-binding universal stress UspA family protein
MLNRILVGITQSQYSRAAADLALSWAVSQRSNLIGVSVVDVSRLAPAESVPLGAGAFKKERDDAVLASAHRDAEKRLADFENRCRAANVACRVLKLEGDAAEVLAREAQRCDVVMVGKKTVPHDDHSAASETLDRLLHHTPRPAVCVPAEPLSDAGALIAYDGSLQAARTLFAFNAAGIFTDRELHLLAVEDKPGKLSDAIARASDFLELHGDRVRIHVEHSSNPPAQVISQYADHLQPALIVMGAYGRPWWAEFFLGSVTRTLLRATRVPLFLFH